MWILMGGNRGKGTNMHKRRGNKFVEGRVITGMEGAKKKLRSLKIRY